VAVTAEKNLIVPMAASLTDLGFGGEALNEQATEQTEDLKRKKALQAQMQSALPNNAAADLGMTPGGLNI
jgi:hypothetical protein